MIQMNLKYALTMLRACPNMPLFVERVMSSKGDIMPFLAQFVYLRDGGQIVHANEGMNDSQSMEGGGIYGISISSHLLVAT